MNKVCMHYYISGKVQGVWFRASTQKEAKQLGLTGWVRNLPDNRVEVLACGEKEAIAKLSTWLNSGPPLAKVSEVASEESAWEDHADFTVR